MKSPPPLYVNFTSALLTKLISLFSAIIELLQKTWKAFSFMFEIKLFFTVTFEKLNISIDDCLQLFILLSWIKQEFVSDIDIAQNSTSSISFLSISTWWDSREQIPCLFEFLSLLLMIDAEESSETQIQGKFVFWMILSLIKISDDDVSMPFPLLSKIVLPEIIPCDLYVKIVEIR